MGKKCGTYKITVHQLLHYIILSHKQKHFYEHHIILNFKLHVFAIVFLNYLLYGLFATFYQNLWFLLGKAEEFKVAAVNKNGPGEFSHVIPVHVVKGTLNIQIIKQLFNSFNLFYF